jgi:hypothetical protein
MGQQAAQFHDRYMMVMMMMMMTMMDNKMKGSCELFTDFRSSR